MALISSGPKAKIIRVGKRVAGKQIRIMIEFAGADEVLEQQVRLTGQIVIY